MDQPNMRTNTISYKSIMAIATLLALFPPATFGETNEWTGGNGNWSDGTWSEGVAGTLATALILNGTTVTITGSEFDEASASQVEVRNGSGLRFVNAINQEGFASSFGFYGSTLCVEGTNDISSFLTLTDSTITLGYGATLAARHGIVAIGSLALDFDEGGLISPGSALDVTRVSGIDLNLSNFGDGAFTLIDASSGFGTNVSADDFLSLCQVTGGNNAADARLYMDGLRLMVEIGGAPAVPEPAAYAMLAGLAMSIWAACRRGRRACSLSL